MVNWRNYRGMLLAACISSAACAAADLPEGASGNWGGDRFALQLSDTMSWFRFVCGGVRVQRRIVIGAITSNSIAFSVRDTFNVGYGHWPVTIAGNISASTVEITMKPGWPLSDSVAHFVAHRDDTPYLGSGICLA